MITVSGGGFFYKPVTYMAASGAVNVTAKANLTYSDTDWALVFLPADLGYFKYRWLELRAWVVSLYTHYRVQLGIGAGGGVTVWQPQEGMGVAGFCMDIPTRWHPSEPDDQNLVTPRVFSFPVEFTAGLYSIWARACNAGPTDETIQVHISMWG